MCTAGVHSGMYTSPLSLAVNRDRVECCAAWKKNTQAAKQQSHARHPAIRVRMYVIISSCSRARTRTHATTHCRANVVEPRRYWRTCNYHQRCTLSFVIGHQVQCSRPSPSLWRALQDSAGYIRQVTTCTLVGHTSCVLKAQKSCTCGGNAVLSHNWMPS